MRVYCVAVLIALGAAGSAHAKSIQAIGASTASPSIIYLGAPAPAAEPPAKLVMDGVTELQYPTKPPSDLIAASIPVPGTQISASIVALGEPGVEEIKVASVPKKKSHTVEPVVLRGGVWGQGSAEPAASVTLPTAQPKQPDAAPADVHKEASAPPSQKPKEPPVTPQPAPAAPPAPRPEARPAPGVGSVQ